MGTEQLLKEMEQTIKRVCKDIKKKQGAVGVDKLNSLSKLVNSYGRLLDRNKAACGTSSSCDDVDRNDPHIMIG